MRAAQAPYSQPYFVQVPKGVTRVMTLALATLSLKGGAATGAALLQGLLVTGPALYYAAALQLAITGEEEEGRQAVIRMLLQVPVDSLPLPVLLDSMLQVGVLLSSLRTTVHQFMLNCCVLLRCCCAASTYFMQLKTYPLPQWPNVYIPTVQGTMACSATV